MVEVHRIRLQVIVIGESTGGYHVELASNRRRAAWVPKSLVALEGEQSDGTATLLITQALASTRGLVS